MDEAESIKNEMATFSKITNIDEVHKFWFSNPDIWFNATPEDDQIIRDRFTDSVMETHPVPAEMTDREFLVYILVYDQFVRHIYRNDAEAKDKIMGYHALAFGLSMWCINNGIDRNFLPEERCFILLPLRHTFDPYYVKMSIDIVKEYREEADSKYYIRFFRVAVLSYSKLIADVIEPVTEIDIDLDICSILDPTSVTNLIEICNVSRKEKIYKEFEKTITDQLSLGVTGFTVSLSGGVDSMISTLVLHHLSRNRTRFDVVATMIDYGNRDEHVTETEFVKRWCLLLNIPLYIMPITEIKRERGKDRELYEEVTRKIRFYMYKKLGYPVIFGHNQDDCLENIIANIRKKRSLHNLRGMLEVGKEDGVQIIRPMLNVSKSEIYTFANKHLVPHLVDSTPKWSDRGKMRDELFPFLNTFDGDIVPGLLHLADTYADVYGIANHAIDMFYEKVEITDTIVTIPLIEGSKEKKRLSGHAFWKEILYKVSNDINGPIPSNGAIETWCDRINNHRYGKLVMGDTVRWVYTETGLTLRF